MRRNECIPELFDGQWFEDKEGFLYIVPKAGAVMEIAGPDSDIRDSLNRVCRANDGVVPDADAEELGLTAIPNHLRRWNPIDGYYHA